MNNLAEIYPIPSIYRAVIYSIPSISRIVG